jgi:hypothetical protein
MVEKLSRSVSSFITILVCAVVATALFAGTAGFAIGSEDLGGEFSTDQIHYVDGLVFGTQVKVERDQWSAEFKAGKASEGDTRAFPVQRCAGKFFPDHPVAMKGCLAAQEPRPPKGYQYP